MMSARVLHTDSLEAPSALPGHSGLDPLPQSAPPTHPAVVINWVQYLGPPGPFSFPDSRDLLEVLGDFLGRERERGGSLGDHPGP